MNDTKRSPWFPVLLVTLLLVGGSVGSWLWRRPAADEPTATAPAIPAEAADLMALYQRLCAAKAAAGEGRHQEALTQFEAIARNAAGTAYGWDAEIQAGFSLAALGRHDPALASMERVIRECPDDHEASLARLGKADVLIGAGRHEDAHAILQELINLEKERQPWLCEEALIGLAKLHESRKHLGRLRGTLARLIYDHPGPEDTRRRLAETRIEELDVRLESLQRAAIQNWTGTRVENLAPGTTHWTAENGPYLVTTPLTVGPDDALNIGAGTKVRFTALARIEVRGHLTAAATPDHPVEFSSLNDEPGGEYWQGLTLEGAQARVELAHCRLLGADTAVTLRGGAAALTDCVIERTGRAALRAEEGASLTLTRCSISEGDRCGIECQGQVALRVTDSIIEKVASVGLAHTRGRGESNLLNTTWRRCGEAGITLRGEVFYHIDGCRILENGSDGVAVRDGGTIECVSTVIAGNSGAGLRGLDRSTLKANECRVLANRGGGISAEARCAGTITRCAIVENEAVGISLTLDSPLTVTSNRISRNHGVGVLLRGTTPEVLTDNDLSDNSDAGLKNEGPNKVIAAGNWWGSAEAVAERIQDARDQSDWGDVESQPALTSPPALPALDTTESQPST